MSLITCVKSAAVCLVGTAALLAGNYARADTAELQAVMPCEQAANASPGDDAVRYPLQAQKSRRQGSVELRVLVDASGHASNVAISASSGFSDLDSAARKAARKARFCQLDGHSPAASGYAAMRVDFRLEQLVANR